MGHSRSVLSKPWISCENVNASGADTPSAMALCSACLSACRLQGAAVVSCEEGAGSPCAGQSCPSLPWGAWKQLEKAALCTQTYPLSTKMLSDQRPTVPLPKLSSGRNRQLLEAGEKLLHVEDTLHQKRVLAPLRGCGHEQAMLELEHTWGHCRPSMAQAGAGTLRERAAETIKQGAAEVVEHTVAERNHHR